MTRGRPRRTTHGDYGYAQRYKCTCELCLKGRARYAKRLEADHARGIKRRQDAAPARAHIQGLLDKGIIRSQIEREAGITHTQFASIMVGRNGRPPSEYILKPTYDKIMALTFLGCIGQEVWLPSFGVFRRIRALEAMGHSKRVIGEAMGLTESRIHQLCKDNPTLVTPKTIQGMDQAYSKLAMVMGDNERIRWRARFNDYPPPGAWEDGTLDDPDAKPLPSRCVVEGCTHDSNLRSLCQMHYDVIERRGAFRPGRGGRDYRNEVLAAGRRQKKDRKALMTDLSELKAQGVLPDEAARRVGAGATYVEKIWKNVA